MNEDVDYAISQIDEVLTKLDFAFDDTMMALLILVDHCMVEEGIEGIGIDVTKNNDKPSYRLSVTKSPLLDS